jgi:hypothetical protein
MPPEPISNDFTYSTGLAGLGEVYLDAHGILKDQEWKKRADWIASLFTHCLVKNERGVHFWMATGTPDLDPDLMSGASGIAHFLMRYNHPATLSHLGLPNEF